MSNFVRALISTRHGAITFFFQFLQCFLGDFNSIRSSKERISLSQRRADPYDISALSICFFSLYQSEPEFRPPVSELVQALVRLVQRSSMTMREDFE